MRSADALSIYSTSTLVGGGEEEARQEVSLRRAVQNGLHPNEEEEEEEEEEEGDFLDGFGGGGSTINHSNYHDLDLSSIGDRLVGGLTHSRQGSLSTLYATPTTNNNASRGRNVNSAALAPRPRITEPEEEPRIEESNLQVPWWSPILPTPVLGRRKSSGRLPFSSSSPSSPDRVPPPSTASHISPSTSTSSSTSTSTSSMHQRLSPGRPAANNGTNSNTGADLGRGSNQHHSPPQEFSFQPSYPDFADIPVPPPMPFSYPLYTKCYCEENAYLLAAYLSRVCQSYNEQEALSTSEARVRWDVDIVVVSNKNRTVSLFEQKASTFADLGYQVIWDYHVFVVVSCQKDVGSEDGRGKETAPATSPSTSRISRSFRFSRRGSDGNGLNTNEVEPTATIASWVYDLDSRIPSPVPLPYYLLTTFGAQNNSFANIPKKYRPSLRIIPANSYFTRFGSDRSHMKRPTLNKDSFEWISPRPEWGLILGSKAAHSSTYFMDTFVDMRVKVGDGRFGTVVKLEELMIGVGLMTERTESESQVLAAGVNVLLDRIPLDGQGEQQEEEEEGATTPVARRLSSTDEGQEAEEELSPGFIIGGVQRYGIRPPPPPPDGAIIPTNRGKRVTDPMFPAYILSAFEHRAGTKNRNSIIQPRDGKVPV